MNNFNFGEVLTRSWQIIWKHKVLWVFGILASCARGGGGGSSSGGGNSGYQSGSGDAPFSGGQVESFMNQAGNYLQDNWWIIIVFSLLIILLSFAAYLLGMMGRIGLIRGTAQADKGAESLVFAELWAESMPFFWRIFGLNFLIGFAFFVILLPLILFGILTAGIGFLCIIPLVCIMVPVSWVVMAIVEQAQNAIVLEDLSMLDGFKRGWELVKANAGPVVIMMLILGVGSAVLGLVIALPIIIAAVPLIIGASQLQQSLTPLYITAACCVIYFPILLTFNGVLTAYIQTAWTLTYLQFARQKMEAPVIIEGNA